MEIEFEVEVGFLPVNASLIVEVELPVPVPELAVPVYAFWNHLDWKSVWGLVILWGKLLVVREGVEEK